MDAERCVSMLTFSVCLLSVILVVHGVAEDGFDSRCDYNTTLFVKKGNDATFAVENRRGRFRHHAFYSGMNYNTVLLRVDYEHIRLYDESINAPFLDRYRLNITIPDVTVDRTGMYMYTGPGIPTYCWELFVIDIWNPQDVQTFEEHRPAFIHATPPSSCLIRPRVNATSTWLLNGLNYTETAYFLKQDGHILIPSMPKHLNDKNVTYRIVEDNGNIHEVQLTLPVTYGPDHYLQFSPVKTFYTLTSGELLPDIICSTDCNPTCHITWDRSGVGNVLSLGHVDRSSSGTYTCQATRNGSDVTVERSLYVEVTGLYAGNTPFIISIGVVGAVQVITMICLGVCAVCVYRTLGRNGQPGKKEGKAYIPHDNRTNQHVKEKPISTVELAHYEAIDKTEADTEDFYENI